MDKFWECEEARCVTFNKDIEEMKKKGNMAVHDQSQASVFLYANAHDLMEVGMDIKSWIEIPYWKVDWGSMTVSDTRWVDFGNKIPNVTEVPAGAPELEPGMFVMICRGPSKRRATRDWNQYVETCAKKITVPECLKFVREWMRPWLFRSTTDDDGKMFKGIESIMKRLREPQRYGDDQVLEAVKKVIIGWHEDNFMGPMGHTIMLEQMMDANTEPILSPLGMELRKVLGRKSTFKKEKIGSICVIKTPICPLTKAEVIKAGYPIKMKLEGFWTCRGTTRCIKNRNCYGIKRVAELKRIPYDEKKDEEEGTDEERCYIVYLQQKEDKENNKIRYYYTSQAGGGLTRGIDKWNQGYLKGAKIIKWCHERGLAYWSGHDEIDKIKGWAATVTKNEELQRELAKTKRLLRQLQQANLNENEEEEEEQQQDENGQEEQKVDDQDVEIKEESQENEEEDENKSNDNSKDNQDDENEDDEEETEEEDGKQQTDENDKDEEQEHD